MAEGHSDLERISGADPLPASLEPARAKNPIAWEPVTPRGVAAFAHARWGRYMAVAALVAVLSSAAVVWFVAAAWAPVVASAIDDLPDTGQIQHRQLNTPRASLEPLALNSFLGLGVDLDARANANVGADIYVKFQRTEVLFCSFLGCAALPYPAGWTIQFNRPELTPWWGAWKPVLMVAVFLSVAIWLMLSWLLLGLLYTPVVWLTARGAGRKLGAAACWKLGAAANLPGALGLTLAIVAYLIGPLGLISFCVAALAHFVPAWVYLFVCPRHIPKVQSGIGSNPFGTLPNPTRAAKGENVFRPDA